MTLCAHCSREIVPAKEFNGCWWRHASTGFRMCHLATVNEWATPYEQEDPVPA